MQDLKNGTKKDKRHENAGPKNEFGPSFSAPPTHSRGFMKWVDLNWPQQ